MKFINRKFVWLILSLFVFSLQTNCKQKAFDKAVLSDKGKEHYQTLLQIDMFALNGIGSDAHISEGETALKILMQEKEAVSALQDLVKNATPEGGLYALVGLKTLKCDCFKREIEKFRDLPEIPDRIVKVYQRETPKGYIFQMNGCLFQTKRRLELANEIEAGEYDFYIENKLK